MAITVPNVVKVTGSGVTTVTTSGVTTTTGSTFIAWTTADDGVTINAPTDSKSNSYGTAKVTVSTGGGTSKQTVYVKENGAGGSGHTLTFTFSSGTYPTCFFAEAAGAATASYDSGSLTSGASGAGSPFNRNSGGQAQAANAIFSFVATDAGGALTYTNSGYTVSEEGDANNYWTGAIGRQIVNTTSAVASSWVVAPGASNGGTVTFAIKEAVGGAAYELTVDPASYSLTEAAETVTATRALTIEPASYSVTAAAVNLAVGRAVNFAPASYALTAAAETLTTARALSIDPASYSLTNSAVTLSVGRALNDAAASYTLTTSPQTLTVARALSIDTTAYVLTAPDVTLEHVTANPVLIVNPVSYVLSLPDVSVEYGSSTAQRTPGGSGGGRNQRAKKARTYNYDYSSPKAEVVEPEKAPIKAVKQKAKKVIPADVAEMMQLLEASQNVTAEVLSEQMAMRAAEEQMFAEEEEMMAVIALCL